LPRMRLCQVLQLARGRVKSGLHFVIKPLQTVIFGIARAFLHVF
jgi:hypothetical protein